MNWHMTSNELPEFNEDVLVCFDNGACVVACLIEEENHCYWWTLDREFDMDSTDMWCKIILPTAEEYHK